MSRDRGGRLQNALAAYLRTWWPHAESAGAGRNGRDVLGTPGIWWENKTQADGEHRPGQFIRQAVKGAEQAGEIPVVVWWPPGAGKDSPGKAVAMVPLPVLMTLLEEAKYTP
jgi:hypothetical protein